MLWPTSPATAGLILQEKVETQLHKITEQITWLKKVPPSMGSFFDLFDFDWLESWGRQFQSTLQTLGIILLIIIIVVSLYALFSHLVPLIREGLWENRVPFSFCK